MRRQAVFARFSANPRGNASRLAVALWLVGSAGCLSDGRVRRGDAAADPQDAGARAEAAAPRPADDGGGAHGDGDAADGGAGDGSRVDGGDAGPPCEGLARCGDGCVDLATDPAHCGRCDRACLAPAHAVASCEVGACGYRCAEGFADCAGGAADGCETDTRSDPAHCGGCGIPCGEHRTCAAGVCQDLPHGMDARPGASPCGLSDPPPRRLSATGCYASLATRAPAPGLIPYAVNALLWADGTGKGRYLVVPPSSTIGYRDAGAWSLPVGTILIKEFLLETVEGDPTSEIALETRFLVRRPDRWDAYTYKWNDAQTEALFDFGGRDDYLVTTASGTSSTYTHWFPSRDECAFCHNGAAGVVLGLRTVQMNRSFDYGAVTDNQLRTFAHVGLFSAALPAPPSALPTMPDPADPSAPLGERARSYLEGNCAHCHLPGGPTERSIDLRFLTPIALTRTCDVVPESETLGIAGARIVAPGSSSRSVLYHRMSRRGWAQMPLVGTLVVDPQGAALVRSWIDSMTGCP